MQQEAFTFILENTCFHGIHWFGNTPKRVVILVHGMGEHSGRYASYVVPRLLSADTSVIAFDHFGHGKTEGKRGHCPHYDALIQSVDTVFQKARDVYPELPVFLYGHSMGGNVVANYLLKRTPPVKGAILSSPFFRLAFQPPSWKISIGKILKNILPGITMPLDLDTNALSRDPKEINKYINDPLVHNRVSPNFSFPVMEAGEWALHNAHLLEVPVLAIHGTQDRIIDHKATKAFASASPKVTMALFENGFHELHNDLEKENVLDTVLNWILTQCNNIS
ncbi:lysophospholipase [Ascidiimonas aurantiaca]|uniref:alpha/beta hydrolase n=1 Tax=Ascidiimonas aurantiaca TaxID=1685432 RepID=UPI0030EF9A7E